MNLRPEYRAEWMARSCYHQIALAPLDARRGGRAARRPARAAIRAPRALAARIQQRTGGNPFFTEEVVQSLVESGQLVGTRGRYRLAAQVETLDVPATVQAVLAARIDRLPEREKQVLQAASVIGREFSLPVLAQTAQLPAVELAAALAQLRAAELVFEQSLYPIEEYVFKHALTQEVAYASQLRERRARGHAAAARAIEALSPGKLDESASLLAHHWEAAGDALQAARWHRRAAEWVSDLAAVKDHWLRGAPARRRRPPQRANRSSLLSRRGSESSRRAGARAGRPKRTPSSPREPRSPTAAATAPRSPGYTLRTPSAVPSSATSWRGRGMAARRCGWPTSSTTTSSGSLRPVRSPFR